MQNSKLNGKLKQIMYVSIKEKMTAVIFWVLISLCAVGISANVSSMLSN